MVQKKCNKETSKYLYKLGRYAITILLIMIIVLIQSVPIINAAEENEEKTESTGDTETVGKIDAAKCVKISGDAENGYYLEFDDEANEKIQEVYDKNKTRLLSAGVDSVDTLKRMIKAELATTMPDLGGVVTSSNPISNGTEAPAHPGGSGSSGGSVGTATVVIDGEYIWPVADGNPGPEARAAEITDLWGERHIAESSNDFHYGIDIDAGENETILAVADGTVIYSGRRSRIWKLCND